MSENWRSGYQNVLKNCADKYTNLKDKACLKSHQNILRSYYTYYRDAKQDYDAYDKMVITPALNNEIKMKINNYNQSCNDFYPMYRDMFKKQCVSKFKKFFTKQSLIFLSLIAVGIILIVVGLILNNKMLKIIMLSLGGLIITILAIILVYNLFFRKSKDVLPFF
jgi:hypothetical protein